MPVVSKSLHKSAQIEGAEMKTLLLLLLALLLADAHAQVWDYQGGLMTGTDTVNIYNTTGGFTTTATPVSEAFSAQVVVSGASLTYTLDLGNQIIASGTTLATGGALGPGWLQPTYANGAIDGFDLAINCNVCNGKESYGFNLTPTGDSYYLAYGNTVGFSTEALASTSAGVWVDPPSTVIAPEIEPTGALGAFLLLALVIATTSRQSPRRPAAAR
jgi:hypothetical protein